MVPRKTSESDAGSLPPAGDPAPIHPAELTADVEGLLGLVADRALVLHGPPGQGASVDRPGDLDCAVAGLDPWWPLKMPPEWRLCQCLHYDVRARTWILERNGRIIWIDTLEDPRGIGRIGFPTANLFGSSGAVRTAAPALRAAYLTAKRIQKGDRDREQWQGIGLLARDDPRAFLETLRTAIGRRLDDRVGAGALEGEPPDDSVWRRARGALLANRLRSPGRIGEVAALGARRWAERLVHPTGLVVLLAGPDGSGKSTLAGALPPLCKDAFVRHAAFHWRPGFLPRLGALLGRGAADRTRPHARPAYGTAISLLLAGYYWVDFVVGGWLRVSPVRLRGGLVVIERGWWDLAVDPKRYRLNVPGWVIRLLGAMVPRPDVAFVLEADPAVLHARKAELSEEELARQSRAWRKVLPQGVPRVHLDSSQDPHAVQAQAHEHIVARLERRAVGRLASGWGSLSGRGGARWLIPRGPARLATNGLNIFQPMNVGGRVAWEAARVLSSVGAFRLLPRGPAPPRSVRERVAGHMPPRSTVAVARANHPGRFVALILSEEGRPRKIAKVATDPRGEGALEREALAIESLGALLSAPLRPPVILAREPGVLVLEAERWRPRSRPWYLDRDVAMGMGRFFAAGARDGGATGPAHGDFAPWNLMRTERGWVLIDWEYAFDDAPLLYDLFHFLVQSCGHLRRPRIDRLLRGLRAGEGLIGASVEAYLAGSASSHVSVPDRFEEYLVASRERLLQQSPLPGGDIELREGLLRRLGS